MERIDRRARLFIIPIEPRAAARPRFYRGRAHTEPKYKDWQIRCAQLLRPMWDHDPLTKVSHMEVLFIGANRRMDLDNCLKSITDVFVSCQILRNDNLTVLDSVAAKYHHSKDQEPCIIVKLFD